MGDMDHFLNRHTAARVVDYPDNSGATDLVPFPECRDNKTNSVSLNQTLVRIMKNTLNSVDVSDRKLDNLLATQLKVQNQQIRKERACLRRLRNDHKFSRHMMHWIHNEQVSHGDLRGGKRKKLPPIGEVLEQTAFPTKGFLTSVTTDTNELKAEENIERDEKELNTITETIEVEKLPPIREIQQGEILQLVSIS